MPHLIVTSVLALLSMAARAGVQADAAAPDFTLPTLAGKPLRLGEQRGHVVLVNFWASWCGPCKLEMPQLNRLHDSYRPSGLVLLGINVDDDPKRAAEAATRMGIKFPVLLDSDKAVVRRWDLGSMPATVLVDRDGRVRALHRGWRDGLDLTYEKQIRELIKE
jgi:peroxiredoxin